MLTKWTVGVGGTGRQNIPDGGNSVGKDKEIQNRLVGMVFKCKGDGEIGN